MAPVALQSSMIVEERVGWVDTAKGFCIILVVMMHATLGIGHAMGGEGFLHSIVTFAKPFRMPDFFLMSGLFLSAALLRDTKTYLERRVLHFVYFYVLWLVIQSCLKYGQIANGSLTGFGLHLVWSLIEPYSTLWFLHMLVLFSLAARLLRHAPPVLLLTGAAVLEILPIHTSSFVINEFCDRFVFFAGGWLLAPQIFALARQASLKTLQALVLLVGWALLNGIFAFTPAPLSGYDTLAQLPVISLGLGIAGAMAIVTLAALLTRVGLSAPLDYCGRNSIAIYLAFFLPMAVTREILIRTGLVQDIGLVSLLVTVSAILFPLLLERLVRHTPARYLFVRPDTQSLTTFALMPLSLLRSLRRAGIKGA
jgi:uncharacterized membrane protein YcfT